MLEDRNLSSHIYNEEMSNEIFERIKNVYIDIKILFNDKFKEIPGIYDILYM